MARTLVVGDISPADLPVIALENRRRRDLTVVNERVRLHLRDFTQSHVGSNPKTSEG